MIIFQNKGLIDPATITTLGVSVKEGAGPIGYFGTGLKFAIATILRQGDSITVWRGAEPFRFEKRAVLIRGQEFEQVCMNGNPLGFTTQLGRDWKPWMAFRELASNCRDESGHYWQETGDHPSGWFSAEDMTTITVEGPVIEAVWPERGTILLESTPIASNQHISVHTGRTKFIYYKGVRVYEYHRELRHTYNIHEETPLTEDRTLKYWFQAEHPIARGLVKLTDRNLLRDIMTCGEGYAEHYLDLQDVSDHSVEFCEMARQLTLGGANTPDLNPKVASFARTSALRDLRVSDSLNLETHQQRMLERALTFLKRVGFPIDRHPLIVVDSLGPKVYGLAKDDTIYLSRLPFQKGTREVAATLLEEYAHLDSGAGDCTRAFQNWLFDQLLVQVERASGEPF